MFLSPGNRFQMFRKSEDVILTSFATIFLQWGPSRELKTPIFGILYFKNLKPFKYSHVWYQNVCFWAQEINSRCLESQKRLSWPVLRPFYSNRDRRNSWKARSWHSLYFKNPINRNLVMFDIKIYIVFEPGKSIPDI